MKKLTMMLSILATHSAMANEVITDELSTPTAGLVTTIHEFCLEQALGQDEVNTDSETLQCVNSDLEISTYKTFKTYPELTLFISQEKGE